MRQLITMRKAATSPAGSRKRVTLAAKADPHALYEQSVQDAGAEIDFVDASFLQLRGRHARSLREDFCGTAKVACAWVKRRDDNRAVGVDLDPAVLAWAQARNVARLKTSQRPRMRLLEGDVLSIRGRPVDILLAMNFSYWLFKRRENLRAYFRAVHRNLKADGVFFIDCYGGYDAFKVLRERRQQAGFTYVWEQASYNPITGDLTCHIHFNFSDGSKLPRAFSYDWRLWTLPELQELLAEAGFSRTLVYWQGWDPATGEGNGQFAATETAAADAGWLAYLAAAK